MTTERSLAGVRVAVTRSDASVLDEPLTRLLLDRGANPIAVPLTESLPPSDPGSLPKALRDLRLYDWLVVTSARTAASIREACRNEHITANQLRGSGIGICAVGPHTAEALARIGLPPDIVPDRFNAEGVVALLLGSPNPKRLRVLFPRAEQGRDLIPSRLAEAGVHVDVIAAYRTGQIPAAGDRLCDLVSDARVNALTFTAGSAVRVFADAWSRRDGSCVDTRDRVVRALPADVGVVALGPATASVLDRRGINVHAVAQPHTLRGLVAALESWSATRQP